MLILYYPPFWAADEAELSVEARTALVHYLDALAGYSDDTLRAGWKAVLANHKVARWPVIGEIVSSCDALAPKRQSYTGPVSGPRNPAAYAADNYRRIISDFMRDSAGLVREAREQGWWSKLSVDLQKLAIAAAQDEYHNRGQGLALTADQIAHYRGAA